MYDLRDLNVLVTLLTSTTFSASSMMKNCVQRCRMWREYTG